MESPFGKRPGILAFKWAIAVLLVALAVGFKAGPYVYNRTRLARLQGTLVYDEGVDGRAELAATLELANREHRRVLVIMGGNWCQWCLVLDDLVNTDREIRTLLHEQYAVLRLDANAASLLDETWGRPTRGGVPVLVFLDGVGRVLHVQETVSLETWGGRLLLHDRQGVLDILRKWAGSRAG